MKFHHSLRWLALVIVTAFFLHSPAASAAEAKRDAQSVVNEMRLKKWTKDLSLTAEQQKKVQTILDEEGQQIAKLDADSTVDLNARKTKVNDLRQASYTKIKPVLNAEQLASFEKMLVKMQPKKK
jgi:ATP sulfurylase